MRVNLGRLKTSRAAAFWMSGLGWGYHGVVNGNSQVLGGRGLPWKDK